MRLSTGHRVALGCFGVVWAVSWVDVPWPVEKGLHDSLAVIGLVGLYFAWRRYRLPLRSWCLVLLFLSVHEVAAHWLYSAVPYDDWTRAVFGVEVSEVFGWERNHFDRLVHFVYGACAVGVLAPLFREWTGRAWRWCVLRSLEIVLWTSALYELFEWVVAQVLAPDIAESYNGQQGDPWDPHRDIAMALLGAVVVGVVILIARRRTSVRQRA